MHRRGGVKIGSMNVTIHWWMYVSLRAAKQKVFPSKSLFSVIKVHLGFRSLAGVICNTVPILSVHPSLTKASLTSTSQNHCIYSRLAFKIWSRTPFKCVQEKEKLPQDKKVLIQFTRCQWSFLALLCCMRTGKIRSIPMHQFKFTSFSLESIKLELESNIRNKRLDPCTHSNIYVNVYRFNICKNDGPCTVSVYAKSSDLTRAKISLKTCVMNL